MKRGEDREGEVNEGNIQMTNNKKYKRINKNAAN